MAKSLLYYPTINIEDSEWLRSAALYWDEVCSIVPYEGFDDFSPEIQYMREREQYRAIYPQDMLNSAYAEEFMKTIKKRMQAPFSLSGNFNEQKTRVERDRAYAPELNILIHYRKFPNEFVEELIEIGNIRADENGWIEMDARLADIYMKTLAEYVALHDKEDVVISSDKISKINEFYRTMGRKSNNLKCQTLSIALEQCLPVPSMTVPFEDLLDFKRNRRDDLYEIQRKISQLEVRIAYCESQAEVKSVLHQFRADWQHELENAEKLFRGDCIQFVLDSMGIFVGAAGGSVGLLSWLQEAGTIGLSSSAIGVAVGMSGVIAVGVHNRNYWSKIKAEQRERGFAYLVGAKHNLLLRDIELI